jgi:hypothetical protein
MAAAEAKYAAARTNMRTPKAVSLEGIAITG